ncbi:hypothetical protein R6Z07F_004614 [Ovis aries]
MGEHNLLNPGFVGPLVNIHTGDTFYFPNFRASGAQLPGLPSLSYPRRDNVCSLPWPSAEPCNGYPQPYLGSPVSLNPPFGRTCELARVEDSKGYYREPCAEGGGGLKREERGRDPGPGVGPGAALLPLEPSGPPALGFKYDYAAGGGDGGAGPPHDPPSCQSLESDSSSSLLNEGNKGAGAGDPGSLVSPLNPGGGLAASGAPWYPIHSRSRKKRKPYSKLQLAELEGEFLVNEFITRQRRRELSDRLNLSDQQAEDPTAAYKPSVWPDRPPYSVCLRREGAADFPRGSVRLRPAATERPVPRQPGAELAIAAPSETKPRRPLVADTGAWPLAPQPEPGALRAPARRTGLRDLGPVPREPNPTSDPGRPGSQRGNTVRLPAPAPPPHVAASPTNSASRRPRAAGPRE